ncbi:MAG: hypothetical protein QXV05_03530 [Candidatus Korarchaeum sp.]
MMVLSGWRLVLGTLGITVRGLRLGGGAILLVLAVTCPRGCLGRRSLRRKSWP